VLLALRGGPARLTVFGGSAAARAAAGKQHMKGDWLRGSNAKKVLSLKAHITFSATCPELATDLTVTPTMQVPCNMPIQKWNIMPGRAELLWARSVVGRYVLVVLASMDNAIEWTYHH
jgi:hypothetical protein